MLIWESLFRAIQIMDAESYKVQIGGLAAEIKARSWTTFKKKYQAKFKKEFSPLQLIVVASLSLYDSLNEQLKIIAVTFGTKSLPHSLLKQNTAQDLLCDMHAEILAIRAFRRFLLMKINQEDKQYLERCQKKNKFKVKDKYKVYLYCSQIFCGDCCINQQEASFSGSKPLKYLKSQHYPQLKYQPHILRTKPGRLDLPLEKRSHLLSCSDLIAFYNLVGIQGPKLFSNLLPVYLDGIILQSKDKMRQKIVKGISFVERLSKMLKRPQKLIERQLYNIIIEKKERSISSQFRKNKPIVTILPKKDNENRDKQGFQLCGIITEEAEEWINGKTGIPEGSSLKNYSQKGKTSSFCESKLSSQFQNYKEGNQCFKFEAIQCRLKLLFGQWIRQKSEFHLI